MSNIGYIRVSTTHQSTDRQLAGVELDRVYEEKVSGKSMEREQLALMMDYAREGDVIHCHELSRLGRNTKDLLDIIETLKGKGVRVKFHKEGITVGGDQDAIGNLMLTVLSGVAQMERELMLERQAEGLAAAKAKGELKTRGVSKTIDREAVLDALNAGGSVRGVAAEFGISTQTVGRIKKEGAI